MEKIDKPKVFISYAWNDQEYQGRVLDFVNRLVSDGIDVIFDKYDLHEGNDTYAFMEKSVNDTSVTNVLMLLDPTYAEKADNYQGGVGAETQIISAEVYQEVSQEKFLPIVFERDKNGKVCIPTYLKSRFHFDLTGSDMEMEYQRLVRSLYGVETYKKPMLGSKPKWVNEPTTISVKKTADFNSIKTEDNKEVRKRLFQKYLSDVAVKLNGFCESFESKKVNKLSSQEYIDLYDETKDIRDDYLLLCSYSAYVDDSPEYIASLFENIHNQKRNDSIAKEIVEIVIHELFIYTIAYYLKNKEYKEAGYLLSRTYFDYKTNYIENNICSFEMFYSAQNHVNLDNSLCTVDDKHYYSGTAKHWLDNINVNFCSKEEFVFADLICYNYSFFGDSYLSEWKWFPLTYCYDNEYNSTLKHIAKSLVSKRILNDVIVLFGFNNEASFIESFSQVEKALSEQSKKRCRYSNAFNSAFLLSDFIKSSNIGSVK